MAFTPLLFEGFETGGLERATSINGSPTVGTNVRAEANGAYSLTAVGGGLNRVELNPYEYQGSPNSNAKVIGAWIDAQNYDGINYTYLLRVYNAARTVDKFNIRCSQAGRLYIDCWGGALYNGSDGDWDVPHYVEIWYEDNTETAAVEVWVDGVNVASHASINIRAWETGLIQVGQCSAPSNNDVYIDDIYFGEATTDADRLGGMDIFATVGDGSATTGGDTLDAGTWANVQEIPKNDTNLASYNTTNENQVERHLPTVLLTQTNLTGSVTDIQDDPDSPDSNWLTAAGSSTLLASMQSHAKATPIVGAGLQNFRVLLRKNATGPVQGTERAAPDTLALQTNLSGAVTDIDDDPDSPDANWLTASGSSTLRTTFPTPTDNPRTGAGLQNFRVLLRKNATGPSGTPTQDLPPTAILTQTGLSGAITDIDEDPDSPDANWLTTTASNSVFRCSFDTPTATPSGTQTFRVWCRKDASGGGIPTLDIHLYLNGVDQGALNLNIDITSATGQMVTATFDAGTYGIGTGVNVELYCDGTKGGGGPNERNVEIGAVEWISLGTANETQPGYEVRLYENGSVVSAVTAATGTLTDAGGDTIVQLAWDATELGTADGSLVECYINQTSGADRYIEVGAVEWNVDYGAPETQPGYEVRLYENGSVVSAVTAATGTLTDAGGDTIVQLSWDAAELATADGSLVECYINQTSGADRYVEIGAVEWNGAYPPARLAEDGWIEADSGLALGPSGVSGLNEIVGLTTYARTQYSGSGSTLSHSLYRGNDSDGVTELSLGAATVALADFFDLTNSAAIMPLITEHTRVGFGHPVNVDVDIDCTEIIGMVAHVPSSSVPLVVTCTPETLDLTKTDAVVSTNVPLVVSGSTDTLDITTNDATVTTGTSTPLVVTCTPETLGLTKTDATVSTNVPLVISGSTENLELTKTDAAVAITRPVTGSTKALVLTDNDATVSTNVPLVVTCTPEALVLTDNDATVETNVPLAVTGISELLTLADNDATVSTNVPLVVTCTPETLDLAKTNAVVNTNVSIIVTALSVSLELIDNDATISTNVPLVVSGATEALVLTDNDATIDANIPLVVTGATELLILTPVLAGINETRIVASTIELTALVDNDSTVNLARGVLSASEALVLTDNDATITALIPRIVTGITETLTLTKTNATVHTNVPLVVTAASEQLVLTEQNATLSTNVPLVVTSSTEALVLTDIDAVVSTNVPLIVTGTSEALVLSDNDAAVYKSVLVESTTETLDLASNNASVIRGSAIVGSTEALELVAQSATLSLDRGVTTASAQLDIATVPAGVNETRIVTTTVELSVLLDNNAAVNSTRAVTSVSVPLSLATAQATLGQSLNVIGDTAALQLSAAASSVNKTQQVTSSSEQLDLQISTAEVNTARVVSSLSKTLILTESAATVEGSTNLSVQASTSLLVLSDTNAVVGINRAITTQSQALQLQASPAVVLSGSTVNATTALLELDETLATIVGTRILVTEIELLAMSAARAMITQGIYDYGDLPAGTLVWECPSTQQIIWG